jgi:hypothetical protein
MNKDVIYIDVDDDVTAIIGKIKSAKEKIVAIVPPKRPGALQSAVNLRLLDRMAKADKKQLVLISNNQALVALAANAQIPVAKNLQSKPEIAIIPALAVDDGDDIIDGNDVPVGEYAAGVSGLKVSRNDVARDNAIETIDVEKDSSFAPVTMGAGAAGKKAAKKSSNKMKIPNFDSFRKKLFIGIAALIVLIGVLIWAFVFAPAATIIITARTTTAPVSSSVTLSPTVATNYEQGIVKATVQTEKKAETLEFDATGTKNVGENATGTMTVSRTSVSSNALSIPAGTTFTAGGLQFVSTQSATLDGTTIGPGGIVQDSATVTVRAQEVGAEYNVSSRAYQASVGGISAQGSTMAGGSSREVKVPTAADIERAQGDIIGRSTEDTKKALVVKFAGGEKVIDSSFTIERAAAVSAPAEGAESTNGKATLSIETTYTLYAVAKTDLTIYLDESMKQQILNDAQQRVYENGYDNAAFSNFRKDGTTLTAGLTATGQIGPKVEEAQIKELVKGKIYGDAQSALESIEGIQEVDVKFSYFWVRTIPNNVDKIKVEFTLQNE